MSNKSIVILSYLFVNGIVRDNLIRNTDSVLDFAEAKLNPTLRKRGRYRAALRKTMRSMILHGENADTLQIYTDDMSAYLRSEGNSRVNINGLGVPSPDGYSPMYCPRYKTALAVDSVITEMPHYNDIITNELIVTYSCGIYDNQGVCLGVVCINVRIDYIWEQVINTVLTKDGYGVLVSQDLTLIGHPNPNFVGQKMYNPVIPISILTDEPVKTGHISELSFKGRKGDPVIAFFRTLFNSRRLGLLATISVLAVTDIFLRSLAAYRRRTVTVLLCAIYNRIIYEIRCIYNKKIDDTASPQ